MPEKSDQDEQPEIPFTTRAARIGFETIVAALGAEVHYARTEKDDRPHYLSLGIDADWDGIRIALTGGWQDSPDDCLDAILKGIEIHCVSKGLELVRTDTRINGPERTARFSVSKSGADYVFEYLEPSAPTP
jgi:hypothetical protein